MKRVPEQKGVDQAPAKPDRGASASLHNFVASTGHWARRLPNTTDATPGESVPSRPAHLTLGPICVFCDRPSGSVEYAWPEWLGRCLTDQLVVWGKDRAPTATTLERTRTEVDQTVRNVCASCSRGWIQHLEDNVSPFLQSMIAGEPTPLPQKHRELLARWAAKTAVVMEYADDSPVRTPPFACEELRRIGVHPGTQVLVGTYDGDQQILTHEHDLFSRILNGKKRYCSQSTFVIGKAVIQVFSDPWRNNTPQLADNPALPLIPLLPSQGPTIDWPPTTAINDQNDDIMRHGATAEDDDPTQLSSALLD